MSDELPAPDYVDLPDVTSGNLSRLMRDQDPELIDQIKDLVALLRVPRETRLAGWNSFLDSGATSG